MNEYTKALAQALNNSMPKSFCGELPDWVVEGLTKQWQWDCDYIANTLKRLDPAFDKDLFIKACKDEED